jgi:IclR family acetate operon transcriptional repressor
MRLHSLDDARSDRNISFVEQEFQASPGTQSIDRGAQLLALVLEAEAPRALGELAADAGLPKSTASRLLGALERNGLVEQEGLRGAFRAGPVMARYAGRGISARRIVEAAEKPMAALADATGETINVAVAGPGGVEHLAQIESRHYLGTSDWVGRRVPYHCTANGKVLLAFAAAGAAEGPLEALTSRTITELGLSAVAAPVLDDSGRALAALSVSGPTLRLSPRRVAELRPIVIKQARALAEQLGHRTEGVHAA